MGVPYSKWFFHCRPQLYRLIMQECHFLRGSIKVHLITSLSSLTRSRFMVVMRNRLQSFNYVWNFILIQSIKRSDFTNLNKLSSRRLYDYHHGTLSQVLLISLVIFGHGAKNFASKESLAKYSAFQTNFSHCFCIFDHY